MEQGPRSFHGNHSAVTWLQKCYYLIQKETYSASIHNCAAKQRGNIQIWTDVYTTWFISKTDVFWILFMSLPTRLPLTGGDTDNYYLRGLSVCWNSTSAGHFQLKQQHPLLCQYKSTFRHAYTHTHSRRPRLFEYSNIQTDLSISLLVCLFIFVDLFCGGGPILTLKTFFLN